MRLIAVSALVLAAATTMTAPAAAAPLYSVVDIGSLGGSKSFGIGINANGQVTGNAAISGDVDYHAFLYDGTMHDLGTLGGSNSSGSGINASGRSREAPAQVRARLMPISTTGRCMT